MSHPEKPAPTMVLGQMIIGGWITQMVYVAAKLNIATHLAAGPMTPARLAGLTGAAEQPLYRLLRGLASLGVFSEDSQGRFSNTELSDLLREDHPGSQRAMAIMSGEEHFVTWSRLLDGIKTGQVQFDKIYGEPYFDWLGKHPEQAQIFDQAMVGAHGRESDAIAKAYPFSNFKKLTDVGGGNGSVLISILRNHPTVQGVVFDLASVVARTGPALEKAGLQNRCTVAPGSFFESIPAGSDGYMMRHIIHDWNDQQCLTILRNIHKAMKPDATLLVIESIIEPGNGPSFGKLLDLNMLMIPGGMERTLEQYKSLFKEAGFVITRVVPTEAQVSVIEARKA